MRPPKLVSPRSPAPASALGLPHVLWASLCSDLRLSRPLCRTSLASRVFFLHPAFQLIFSHRIFLRFVTLPALFSPGVRLLPTEKMPIHRHCFFRTFRANSIHHAEAPCRHVTVITRTMSSTEQPRDKSFIGLRSPCKKGPKACAFARRSTSL